MNKIMGGGAQGGNPMPYNVRFTEAPVFGQSIYEFAPGNNGADDYRDLVREVTGNEKIFT